MKFTIILLFFIGHAFSEDAIDMFAVGDLYGKTTSSRSSFYLLYNNYKTNKNEDIGKAAMTTYIIWAKSVRKIKKTGNADIDKRLDYELGEGMNLTKEMGKALWDTIDKSAIKEKEKEQIDELFK